MVEILYEGCLFISYTVSYGVTHNGCFVMFHSQHTRCTGNESPWSLRLQESVKDMRHYAVTIRCDEYKI
jgi:hypothetical protein